MQKNLIWHILAKAKTLILDDIRFRNYIVLTPKKQLHFSCNCSFLGGTIYAKIIQKILCENLTYEQALKAVKKKK